MSSKLKNKVIITGATGFIGQHLTPLFLRANYDILAIVRDEEKAKSFSWFKDVKFIFADLNKEEINVIINDKVTLIHLVWGDIHNYNSPNHLKNNLPNSLSFLKKMAEKGVRQILVAGTCFEYGIQCGALDVNMETKPNTLYGVSKDNLRKKMQEYQKSKKFIFQWARLFYMYGKGQNKSSLISQLDEAIIKKIEFKMSGGKQIRDYLPVQKVAKNLFELVEKKEGGIFNICSGIPISIEELVKKKN